MDHKLNYTLLGILQLSNKINNFKNGIIRDINRYVYLYSFNNLNRQLFLSHVLIWHVPN